MFRKSLMTATLAVATLAGAGPGAGVANAAYDLTLCGASPGGLWSLLGAGIDAALKEAHPGSTVTYQTSGGGFANIALLQRDSCELALIHDAEAQVALAGKPPFDQPIDNLRTISVIYTWAPQHFIMRADFAEEHGIESMEDLAKAQPPLRLVLNRRGNVASQVGEALLTAANASVDTIESWGGSVTFAASAEQGDLIRDRRVDAILNSLFVGHRSIRQIADAIDVKLISIGPETRQAVMDEFGIGAFTIPDDAYDWADGDTETVTLSAQLFVLSNADDQMVTDVTRALVEHVDKIQGVHGAMKPLTPELMASGTVVPYHVSAAAVYREAGLQ